MLKEYNATQDVIIVYYDNLCVINIYTKPIKHNKTKHIVTHHHFINELVEDKKITLEHIHKISLCY